MLLLRHEDMMHAVQVYDLQRVHIRFSCISQFLEKTDNIVDDPEKCQRFFFLFLFLRHN